MLCFRLHLHQMGLFLPSPSSDWLLLYSLLTLPIVRLTPPSNNRPSICLNQILSWLLYRSDRYGMDIPITYEVHLNLSRLNRSVAWCERILWKILLWWDPYDCRSTTTIFWGVPRRRSCINYRYWAYAGSGSLQKASNYLNNSLTPISTQI